jgi:hypothetical protein
VCTLTIIPTGGGFRLAVNRDESRTRPAALPPQCRRFGGRTAVLPIDPVSDGTWVAVNDAGLALALLNANPGGDVPPGPKSRGTIIPALLHYATLADALRRARQLPPADYAPFRLVLVQHGEVAALRSGGGRRAPVQRARLTKPLLFTSSGLGDNLVEGPRRRLFRQFFAPGADWVARQDEFHRHSWPERPHLSVCMRRADAATVSFTAIDIGDRAARMTYVPGPPDRPGEPVTAHVPCVEVRVP